MYRNAPETEIVKIRIMLNRRELLDVVRDYLRKSGKLPPEGSTNVVCSSLSKEDCGFAVPEDAKGENWWLWPAVVIEYEEERPK